MFRGIDVLLHVKTPTGRFDGFGEAIYEDSTVTVGNVLVYPAESDDRATGNTPGRNHIAYNLSIPKGDTHEWADTTVEFWGHKWRTVGFPKEYIEALTPLDWNKTVLVERYG